MAIISLAAEPLVSTARLPMKAVGTLVPSIMSPAACRLGGPLETRSFVTLPASLADGSRMHRRGGAAQRGLFEEGVRQFEGSSKTVPARADIGARLVGRRFRREVDC